MTSEMHIWALERDVGDLKAELLEMHEQIEALQVERDRALKWGIATLGALVLSMGAFIVGFVKDHLK